MRKTAPTYNWDKLTIHEFEARFGVIIGEQFVYAKNCIKRKSAKRQES